MENPQPPENAIKPDTLPQAPSIPTPVADTKDEKLVKNEVQETEKRLKESGVLNAELIKEVKKLVTAEIISELKEDKVLKEKELELTREMEDIEYQTYVATRMESDDPWVDIVGDIRDTEKGQRIQLNWNDAFVQYLRSGGVTGADDEQVVQKYITLLLRDMIDKNEDRYGSDYE